MSAGGGLPLLSLLATAFGGYLAMRLWQQWAWASGWGRTPLPRTPMSGG